MAEIILLIVIAGLVLGGLCLLFVGLGVFQLMMKGIALTRITVIFSLATVDSPPSLSLIQGFI